MSGQAWTLAGLVVTSLAGILSAVAAIVAAARSRQARDNSEPTGNGFAPETTASLQRIERQLRDLTRRHVRAHAALLRHLEDHARHDINREDR